MLRAGLGLAALFVCLGVSTTPSHHRSPADRAGLGARDSLTLPTTVSAAEAEGVSFKRAAPPSWVAGIFTREWTGSADRRCLTLPAQQDPAGQSFRSGDFIIRTRLPISAARQMKILWTPLHNPFEYSSTLLVRAARLDDPADSLRRSIADWGYVPHEKRDSAFPSLFTFAHPGRWLIVATAGTDWGCYVLSVGA